MTIPAPEGFRVEQGTGATTVTWPPNMQAKKAAARQLFLCALVLVFLYVRAEQPAVLILLGFALFLRLYQLAACRVNHMTIRANDREWTFRWGPLSTLYPDLCWTLFSKRVDPTQFHQVTSSAVVEEQGRNHFWSFPTTRDTGITYELWTKTRRGLARKVLSRLDGEQAAYLVQVLQPLLPEVESAPACTNAPSRELWSLRSTRSRSLPGLPEVGRVTAAPRIVAASEDKDASATQQVGAVGALLCKEPF